MIGDVCNRALALDVVYLLQLLVQLVLHNVGSIASKMARSYLQFQSRTAGTQTNSLQQFQEC